LGIVALVEHAVGLLPAACKTGCIPATFANTFTTECVSAASANHAHRA